MTAQATAKRGDLAAVVTESLDYIVGEGTRARTSVEVGVVTSVDRNGVAKRVKLAGWGTELDLTRPNHRRSVLIVESERIDVAAALAVAEAHVWPGHSQVKPFESVNECRAALRPCLLASAV